MLRKKYLIYDTNIPRLNHLVKTYFYRGIPDDNALFCN